MSILFTFLTAVGLSMDAFSIAIIYGTLDMNKKTTRKVSISVGVFHFFMPIIGYILGKIILSILSINIDILVGTIFIILSLEMLLSIKKDDQINILTNLVSILIFSFTVSIDSFSVGIAYGALNNSIIVSSIIFSTVSCLFTYIGVCLGKKLVKRFGSISTLIGSIILLILGISYLV